MADLTPGTKPRVRLFDNMGYEVALVPVEHIAECCVWGNRVFRRKGPAPSSPGVWDYQEVTVYVIEDTLEEFRLT